MDSRRVSVSIIAAESIRVYLYSDVLQIGLGHPLRGVNAQTDVANPGNALGHAGDVPASVIV